MKAEALRCPSSLPLPSVLVQFSQATPMVTFSNTNTMSYIFANNGCWRERSHPTLQMRIKSTTTTTSRKRRATTTLTCGTTPLSSLRNVTIESVITRLVSIVNDITQSLLNQNYNDSSSLTQNANRVSHMVTPIPTENISLVNVWKRLLLTVYIILLHLTLPACGQNKYRQQKQNMSSPKNYFISQIEFAALPWENTTYEREQHRIYKLFLKQKKESMLSRQHILFKRFLQTIRHNRTNNNQDYDNNYTAAVHKRREQNMADDTMGTILPHDGIFSVETRKLQSLGNNSIPAFDADVEETLLQAEEAQIEHQKQISLVDQNNENETQFLSLELFDKYGRQKYPKSNTSSESNILGERISNKDEVGKGMMMMGMKYKSNKRDTKAIPTQDPTYCRHCDVPPERNAPTFPPRRPPIAPKSPLQVPQPPPQPPQQQPILLRKPTSIPMQVRMPTLLPTKGFLPSLFRPVLANRTKVPMVPTIQSLSPSISMSPTITGEPTKSLFPTITDSPSRQPTIAILHPSITPTLPYNRSDNPSSVPSTNPTVGMSVQPLTLTPTNAAISTFVPTVALMTTFPTIEPIPFVLVIPLLPFQANTSATVNSSDLERGFENYFERDLLESMLEFLPSEDNITDPKFNYADSLSVEEVAITNTTRSGNNDTWFAFNGTVAIGFGEDSSSTTFDQTQEVTKAVLMAQSSLLEDQTLVMQAFINEFLLHNTTSDDNSNLPINITVVVLEDGMLPIPPPLPPPIVDDGTNKPDNNFLADKTFASNLQTFGIIFGSVVTVLCVFATSAVASRIRIRIVRNEDIHRDLD